MFSPLMDSAVQQDLTSKEDRNSVGNCPVSTAEIAKVKARIHQWLEPGSSGRRILVERGLKLCFVDGFLLYTPQMSQIMKLLDLKIFLLASRAKATERRAARDGYVTLEGFWADPPGYMDTIVWPNYVDAHRWLFRDGNVEGELDKKVLSEEKILAQIGHGLDVPLNVSLDWAVSEIMLHLDEAF